MIKGICAGLGVTETVKSPSFVIVTEYRGRFGSGLHHRDAKGQMSEDRRSEIVDRRLPIPVYHIDLYRLRGPADLEGLDFEGCMESGGICLIEWAERAEGVLPDRTIMVRMAVEGEGRRINVEGQEE